MDNPVVIAALAALAVALLAYALFMPRNVNIFAPDNEAEAEDNFMLKLTTKISSELYATLPAKSMNQSARRPNPRIEALLVKSGNPWGLKADEFIFFQYTGALLGFATGWLIWIPLDAVIGLHWSIVVVLFTLLGYSIPKLKYTEVAKKRDLDFKRHLPESLDLIIISLSASNTFTQAIKESLPNMPEGVLKEEFKAINQSIDTGKTMDQALEDFAKRAPNESISTFVKAVQEANSLNVSLIKTLESRAHASRQEFFALIHNKTASLPSKMMAIITPTLIPALLIIVLLPAGISLLNTLG